MLIKIDTLGSKVYGLDNENALTMALCGISRKGQCRLFLFFPPQE